MRLREPIRRARVHSGEGKQQIFFDAAVKHLNVRLSLTRLGYTELGVKSDSISTTNLRGARNNPREERKGGRRSTRCGYFI